MGLTLCEECGQAISNKIEVCPKCGGAPVSSDELKMRLSEIFPRSGPAGRRSMNLISCRDCGTKISKKAEICPKCGAPTPAGKKAKRKERNRRRGNAQGCGCLLIVIGFFLGVTLIGAPFGGLLVMIGIIILIVGFFL